MPPACHQHSTTIPRAFHQHATSIPPAFDQQSISISTSMPHIHTYIHARNKRTAVPMQARFPFYSSQVYVRALFRAFSRYVGSCWHSWPPSSLILSLLGHILSPSCSKMAPRWTNIAQHSAKLLQNCSPGPPESSKNKKNDASSSLLKVFWGPGAAPGGYVGSSWRYVGLCWAILAPSWAILADLGLKLRPSWQDVSTKIPKMS